ncbi:MAG: potassium-transporting ATPase subunit KdpA, partial [Sphingomonadales bacterium]|nr:potassium-transporting ATPase subunit KdpA [Sphingomonadales bacterium]
MTLQGWILILGFTVILLALTKPMGMYLFALYEGRRTPLHVVLGPVERAFYKLAGIDPTADQSWRRYAVHMLLFNAVLMIFTYVILRLQGVLPLNEAGFPGIGPDGAFNTAISFTTNTNWQWYSGEAAMSNLSQMLGLTIHNFLSAATGIALAFALFRGFARREASGIGNFWADMTRITLYVLLPICIVVAVFYIASGVPQTFDQSVIATTIEGAKQTIPLGPVASQEAIKMLGTNGGGFFNANSAHPFENPTALTNLVQMLSIFVIGFGLTWTFGKAVGNTRQGWAILSAMIIIFLAGVFVCYWQEAGGNPILHNLGIAGGNMEGKEVRFGMAASSLFAVVTTAASCGAVNAMLDSFTALGGMIPLFNMQLGEVVVGGVGAGIYGFLMFAILAVFVAGLRVGRTPEYVGKMIESREVILAVLAIAVLPLMILGLTALSSVLPQGLAGPLNKGPHGFSEILYAFTSAVANNGS